ncbi:VIT and vWA domain-containing protein [Aspergillus novofumigatus IBT 16806]|uniref:von Willebrand domain protein n=1 Tax=Aspergillus novofumigatus (strain IBT 16806) TaxID=1392255 RepID=A0A2I1CN72_ASPN1|nr:von Willebrand domain protein [Aspergillus novofumigatus IBT 16806]PKX99078.1 von Willebrand domain protein [Aspergillus novofumigatus IBT 16806]
MTVTYLCGCSYYTQPQANPVYLPRIGIKAYATILSSVSKTVLTQTYTNRSSNLLEEVSYTFPLYDGVSVVSFNCQIGNRTLHSRVKPRKQAKAEYDDAVSKSESAALMAHSLSVSDVFSIRLGNVGPGEEVVVEITLVGELKQDAQSDAVRYTLPSSIAPRYGYEAEDTSMPPEADVQGISITVDVQMESTAVIREIQSTSHSLSVALGRVSVSGSSGTDKAFNPAQASASVNLKEDRTALTRDFVLLVKADGLDTPRAMLETHPAIPNQRAIMTTLVPKFGLEPIKPEIIFVIDRSGSMMDKIDTLKSALRVFLKSLPVGVCFNICSFGSSYSFLWKQSLFYTAESLQEALSFVDGVRADMGGTEMQEAVEATVHSRMKDKELEVLILTDGQIWKQEALFTFIRETAAADNSARFFSLGIGNGASHSLVEGIARAGNGFSQLVVNYEELDRKVVRMLKGALTPHISDYKLEVEYDDGGDVFGLVLPERPKTMAVDETEKEQQPISLFDADYKEDEQKTDRGALPVLTPPQAIQAPYKIPPLYPFIRTTAYLLGTSTMHNPKVLIFRATSKQGPLVLRIPIDDIGTGESIHQLAVRKAMIEVEEGHGWLAAATSKGNPFNNLHPGSKERIIARECEKLGTQFQVTGKHCSFIALEKESTSDQGKEKDIAHLSTSEAAGQQDTIHQVSAAAAPGPARAGCRRVASKVHRRILPPSPPSQGTRFNARIRAGQTPGASSGSLQRWVKTSIASAVPESLFGAPGGITTASPAAPGMGLGFDALMEPEICPPAHVSEDMMEMEGADYSDGSVGYSPASPILSPHSPNETAGAASQVHRIIALQSFEGYWPWSAELLNALGLHERGIQARLMQLLQKDSRRSNLTVIATMLAMAYLTTKCAADRSVWELVYDKAEGWKRQKLVEMGDVGNVLKAKEKEITALV